MGKRTCHRHIHFFLFPPLVTSRRTESFACRGEKDPNKRPQKRSKLSSNQQFQKAWNSVATAGGARTYRPELVPRLARSSWKMGLDGVLSYGKDTLTRKKNRAKVKRARGSRQEHARLCFNIFCCFLFFYLYNRRGDQRSAKAFFVAPPLDINSEKKKSHKTWDGMVNSRWQNLHPERDIYPYLKKNPSKYSREKQLLARHIEHFTPLEPKV